MSRKISLPLAFVSLLTSGLAAGAGGWTHLKKGMTADETLAALGRPLIQMAGRGFEVWIYDSKAEVVFHQGPVIAWTVPTPDPVSEARPIELDLPLGSPTRLPLYQGAPSHQNPETQGNPALPSMHFRYRQRL
jgi:hypothetical protein